MEEISIKKKLASIKTELKCWESMYLRTHGRKPNQHDISSSGNEVKGAYREYSSLKQRLLEITSTSDIPDKKRTNPSNKQNQDGIFGANLNKKENVRNSKSSHHIKDQSLSVRHKLPLTRKRHLKSTIGSNTNSVANENISNVSVNGRKNDDNEAIHQKKDDIIEPKECITENDVHHNIGITINSGNEFQHSRKTSSVKWGSKSKKLSFNVSKDWLEKLKPVDKNKDDSEFLPFKTFEEERENYDTTKEQALKKTNIGCKSAVGKQEEFETFQETGTKLLQKNETFSLFNGDRESSIKSSQKASDFDDYKGTKEQDLRKTSIGCKSAVGKQEEFKKVAVKSKALQKDLLPTDESSSVFNDDSKNGVESSQENVEYFHKQIAINNSKTELRKECIKNPSLEEISSKHSIHETSDSLHSESKEHPPLCSLVDSDEMFVAHIDSCKVVQRDDKSDKVERDVTGDKIEKDVEEDNINVEVLSQSHNSTINDRCERKRKQSSNEMSEIEESVDNEYIKKPSKRVKKEQTASADAKTKSGRRLVSENFVAIDIQKKKYCRGKRRIKGSTYKRQQWKKKSQFSKQNSATCYSCKGSGHWASECPKFPKKYPRGSSSNVEKKKESYEPTYSTADDADSSTFSFYDIPDLPRCWPRIPYSTKCTIPHVSPLFSPVDGKPSKDAILEVNKTLRKFGYSAFRNGQENAVARIVCGLSTLLVLPTGSGKSLCYQIPAFLYHKSAKCLTIVISPLVALMEDQVGHLPHGLKGACLHTNMTKKQREKVIQDVSDNKIAILLLSPEALLSGNSSTGYLPMLKNLPPIAFVCIDEAHCISEWSHNFRPSYLRVCKVLRDSFGVSCFLGLTATATKSTSLSVAKHLGIPEAETETAIIRGSTMPDNLHITISKDDDRDQALVTLLASEKFSNCTSIIIYCTRRDETERISAFLRTTLKRLPPTELKNADKEGEMWMSKAGGKGKRRKKSQIKTLEWDADSYHAGMTPAQRKKVQSRFMAGDLRIVVATSAFGMGLDKADVRAIVHYNMPKSFESFLQEIGRAGRDGRPAYCHIFLDKEAMDLCELRRHVHGNSVDFKTIKTLVNSIFKRCDCKERFQNSRNSTPLSEHEVISDQSEAAFEELMANELDSNLERGEESHTPSNIYSISDTERKTEYSSDDANYGNTNVNLDWPRRRTNGASEGDSFEKGPNPISMNLCDASEVQPNMRYCSGHQVTLSIQESVLTLDMREENIATLLSYLENSKCSSIILLGTLQSYCTVQCYGGSKQMRLLAKRFLPMTAVFNRMKRENRQLVDNAAISFNMVEVADDMGWDLGPIYRELRSLQWNTTFALSTNDSLIGKSGIMVEFDNLSFHVIAPGDISDDERDKVCSALYETVKSHEDRRLMQLDALYNLFDRSSKTAVFSSFDDTDPAEEEQLRKNIEDYFDCNESEMNPFLERLAPAKIQISVTAQKWDAVSRDVRTMLGLHHDVIFNGRALARIFHGIDSPCFPATVWGRDKRFWRRYLDIDFNELCKFITNEIVRYRT